MTDDGISDWLPKADWTPGRWALRLVDLHSEQEQHHDNGNEDEQTKGSVHGH